MSSMHTAWLIGTDGKRGAVRKTFLEKVADIRQVETDYRYEGTWIATNLKFSLPTVQVHPEFPPWKLGLSLEDVYNLFWPQLWHFCSPLGKPLASGRFGPHDQRLWRHEFKQDNWDASKIDAEGLLWEHLTPMLTRDTDSKGQRFSGTSVYPRDCIEVLRCRLFTFTHEVVNRWFHRKTVLIGDAAHVFSPFGVQGIASDVCDAHQLAWRIALLESQGHPSDEQVHRILETWTKEQEQSIPDAASLTKLNGMLCNGMKPLLFGLVQAAEWVLRAISVFSDRDPQAIAERRAIQSVLGGFFLQRGGTRLPQIHVDTTESSHILSDTLVQEDNGLLQLLVVLDGDNLPQGGWKGLQSLLSRAKAPAGILSSQSVVALNSYPDFRDRIGPAPSLQVRGIIRTPRTQLSAREAESGYDDAAFISRLDRSTRYAIVRPDFYVFAVARDLKELEQSLNGRKGLIYERVQSKL